MSLENNPLLDGTAKIKEGALGPTAQATQGSGGVTITVEIARRKNLFGRLKNKWDHIHLDEVHVKYFGLMYLSHVVTIFETLTAMATLCLWSPRGWSVSLNKRIAVISCDVLQAHEEHMKTEEEKAKELEDKSAETPPMDRDEKMRRFIEKLKDDTIYDTFGNPIDTK